MAPTFALPAEIIEAERKAEEAMNAQVVTTQGFTRGQLLEAFNRMTDPADWRGPISVWVKGEGITIAVEAIKFFTATEPTVSLNMTQMLYLIESEGYRNGPAGDH